MELSHKGTTSGREALNPYAFDIARGEIARTARAWAGDGLTEAIEEDVVVIASFSWARWSTAAKTNSGRERVFGADSDAGQHQRGPRNRRASGTPRHSTPFTRRRSSRPPAERTHCEHYSSPRSNAAPTSCGWPMRSRRCTRRRVTKNDS